MVGVTPHRFGSGSIGFLNEVGDGIFICELVEILGNLR